MTSTDELKRLAAEKAVEQVTSGMVLGLGTGSTTRYAIEKIGRLWQAGTLTNIVGVPTSEETVSRASSYGIPLSTLDDYPEPDLAIDGADEVAPNFDLIKGLGGALLREKMVALGARRFVVIVDQSKLVEQLGANGPLPVEVAQFGWQTQVRWLEGLGCQAERRGDQNGPFVTDNGNYILHCTFPNGIDDPAGLADKLAHRVGVVEHGLFLHTVDEVIVADADGVRSLTAG